MKKRKTNSDYTDMTASIKANDRFGMLYDSMVRSEQYQALSIGAKQFFTCCRIQANSKHGKACLYNHGLEDGSTYTDHDFVFPATHMAKYGYDRSNGHKYLDELIIAGFIDRKENNKHRKKVNVYTFSERWKTMKPQNGKTI